LDYSLDRQKEKDMFNRRIPFILSVLLTLSILITSCGPAATATPIEVTRIVAGTPVVELVTPTPEPKGGDTLSFAISLDPETLDSSMTISETADWVISEFFLESLVYFDMDGTLKGQLAESWDISPDNLQITFHLRQGVKFHDGTDFNADAVKFNFDRAMDPANASPTLPYIPTLKQVDVINPNTVKFTFSEPDAAFWANMTSFPYFWINSPTAVKAAGADYGRHPVGTGPFMFESWIPGSQITMVRYPDYQQWRDDAINQGPALADKVVLYVIPEAGTVRAALQTGEILSALVPADILPNFVGDPNFSVSINKKSQAIQFLEFNNNKPPFDDVNFRKAISYAIDRATIVKTSRGGYAWPMLGLLPAGLPTYDATIGETYGLAYDPAKAKELLAQLGWVAGSDGILVKDGMKASWLIKSYSGYNYVTRSLEVIQQNLRDVGIEAKIELSDWSAFYPSLLDDSLEMDMMNWSEYDAGSLMKALWRSPGYRGHLPENPALDKLLDDMQTTLDPVKRNEISRQVQQMLLENMIAVPIQSNWAISVIRSNVQDYHLDFWGYPVMTDIWLSK
jgi:peptide/nickel transport system substrate-binding protein